MRAQKQRQRVSTACKACRIKRTKCDGHPQQCSACRYRNQPCEYVYTEDRRKPPSKQHVQALEARIHTLERQLAAACARACADDSGSPHAASRVPMAPIRATDIDDVTDTLGSFNIGDGGEICYFGSRSNFNLLRSARLVDRPSSLEMQRRGREATRQQIGLAPVSDELEAHLLGLFWTWQNAWQRVVARAPFLRDRAARSGAPCGRFYSPALLASMLALASRYSDRPEVRADPLDARTAGDTFAAQAKIMLLYECETPTTTTVQAIALLSLRETALDKEGLGWMYCGMAVRMALNLGLHLDCSRCVDEGLLTAEQVEVRSVTWWGCYVLDKLFNIGLGRPSMILDCLMTVEMPSTCCEEEQQPWTSSSADPTDASAPVSHCVSNAIHTCKLLISVVEILDNIYSPGKPDKTSMVSDAHLRLTSFYNALPAVLRISKSYKDRALPHVYQLQWVT
ncbi:putative glutamate carboxypeptidase protein [Neofusicoccum parvum]|uniref:Glutamate carboxypeptidase protein n=1 Tax=Neofusicoccum parvum TaxID=310453 RepID=A0ACB5S0L4_9PEZI|nr:putative glutamate carboxypeptidase protein [Neofusicoccum parvum]GME48240.1 putative glutamate carboxypeptidase protein [Neofusicoccum parvum]